MLRFLKKALRYLRNVFKNWLLLFLMENREHSLKISNMENLDFNKVRLKVLKFIDSMQTVENGIQYRYSENSTQATLYSSAYACMTYSLLGEMDYYNQSHLRKWKNYFDSFQNQEDGLFYDPVVMNKHFPESDWWGARHLALHMNSAYSDLGTKPHFSYEFLQKYYDINFLQEWLDSVDWASDSFSHENDIDNKIMNVACLMQYQRDAYQDEKARNSLEFLKDHLKRKINPETGMWGNYKIDDPNDRSRMVQFAYHLLSIFFCDGDFSFNHELIVDLVLQTQNKYGGYGVQLNSSACEDIDSIDILTRFAPYLDEGRRDLVDASLKKAMKWVLLNQVDDGGFVFRLYDDMEYGHKEMSSKSNKGAMFPTWFRVLSIVMIHHYFYPTRIKLNRTPGLVYP